TRAQNGRSLSRSNSTPPIYPCADLIERHIREAARCKVASLVGDEEPGGTRPRHLEAEAFQLASDLADLAIGRVLGIRAHQFGLDTHDTTRANPSSARPRMRSIPGASASRSTAAGSPETVPSVWMVRIAPLGPMTTTAQSSEIASPS